MRAKSIVALAMVLLCLAGSNAWPKVVANANRGRKLELAGAGDIDDNSFYGTTTLNILVGGVAITLSGWILSKRKIL